MASVRCRGCSNLVAFRGKAALCPQCGTYLNAPSPTDRLDVGESSDTSVGPPVPTMVANYGDAAPTKFGDVTGGNRQAMWLLAGFGALSLVAVGVGLAIVWKVMSAPPPAPPAAAPVAVAPPPPAAVTPTQAPPKVPASQPVPTVPPPTTAATPVPPPPPARVWTPIYPQQPTRDPRGAVTEKRLEVAIRKGVDHILSKFDGPFLKENTTGASQIVGLDALAVYALLAAGKDLQDPKLDVRNPAMRAMLDKLKTSNPDGDREVYCRSLRLQCLAFANRPEDRSTIEADYRWLIRAHVNGAFGYQAAKPGDTRDSVGGGWDTSNSQYGLLGIWAYALLNMETPVRFWGDVESLWLATQNARTGSWGYRGDNENIAMTAAGVNALVVAADNLANDRTLKGRDPGTTRNAAQRGLEYLGRDKRLANFGASHYGYTAFGIERVGLATGYKYIGEVDWFRAMAGKLMQDQREDGSWSGADPDPADTAFCVLFLVRGRPPVMMSKLRYEGPWQRYPRDLANLTLYAGQKTERALNWQVAELKRPWMEWMDSPVLMISGNQPIDLNDADLENLRQYVLHGGVLFTHADEGSEAFTTWAKDLAGKLWAGAELKPLDSDHAVYSMVMQPTPAPPLLGATNGNRLILFHSPSDLAGRWLRRVPPSAQQNLETGLNLFIYSAGKGLARNRIDTPLVPDPVDPPVGSMTLARLKYEGNWDPEPAAWLRLARDFENSTRIQVKIWAMNPAQLPSPLDVPVATLTVTGSLEMTGDQKTSLKRWLESGGVLVVDGCGGSKKSGEGVSGFLASLLGERPLGGAAGNNSAMLTGSGYGVFGQDVTKVVPTDYTIDVRGGRLAAPRITRVGKGMIISTELDMTTALLDTGVWGVTGYSADWVRGFLHNLLLSVAVGTPGEEGPMGKQ